LLLDKTDDDVDSSEGLLSDEDDDDARPDTPTPRKPGAVTDDFGQVRPIAAARPKGGRIDRPAPDNDDEVDRPTERTRLLSSSKDSQRTSTPSHASRDSKTVRFDDLERSLTTPRRKVRPAVERAKYTDRPSVRPSAARGARQGREVLRFT
jgi:hypothetical protein